MMKKFYINLFVFFILSFIYINNVQANYTATVVNPEGASCSLRSNSSGYCFYKDKTLNDYLSPVVWLDTGDEVTVLDGYPNVPTNNSNVCKDYYVYVSHVFYKDKVTYYGYYCHNNLTTTLLNDSLKKEFRDAGFPESYWEKLAILKTAHPNWSFKAINTQLSFHEAVLNQTYSNKSLLRRSMSNNYAYLSLSEDSFNYYNDRFIPYDDTTGSDPWYKTNYNTIAYYMDPRNFLSDMYIFQFETLSYDNNVSDDKLRNSISSIFGNDYLGNYTETFLEAGKESKVNPIYLASLSKEEVSNGPTPGTAIDGEYNNMYNFYNIGANSGADPVYNGLNFASYTDESTLRPWNTTERAIKGGAIWIFNNYVAPGQDTSYFKKYNVVYNYLLSIGRTPIYNNYAHQYMQNISAPSNEAVTTYRSYSKNNMLGLSYAFFIPVYNDMPSSTPLPTNSGWPNNYLKSMNINGNTVAGFDGGVTEYNYNLDINNPVITIKAEAISGRSKIEGTGTFTINGNTTKVVKVTAENGDVKNYKINIKLTGTKFEDPVDVKTTLNNAGIKNNDKYLSGFAVGSDIGMIKTKILNINKDAIVYLKNSSGKEKNSGAIATGDKITVTVNGQTKDFEAVIYGDVSGDGKIDNIDFIRLKKYLLKTITLNKVYEESIDLSKDGKIDNIDFIRLKKYLLGDKSIINQ